MGGKVKGGAGKECVPPPLQSYFGKSSESVQLAMLKACDACADMGQW